ncbi:MAG: DUF4271 domain-containing protein [Bacteroidota bacterium]|nr:DUF4271 domain-containing protein [Bacteroidota bacterium]
MEAIYRVTYNHEIAFIFLLTSFFLLAILKAFYWKTTKLLVLSIFSKRYTNQYLREDNVFTERVNIITFCILLINFSLWLFKLKNEDSFETFSFIIFLIGIYYLAKYLTIYSLGHVFLMKDLSRVVIFLSVLFDKVLFLFLMPVIVLIYFFAIPITSSLLIISIIYLELSFVIKLIYLFKIGNRTFGIEPLYIFLYLCILEVFPITVLIKGLIFK